MQPLPRFKGALRIDRDSQSVDAGIHESFHTEITRAEEVSKRNAILVLLTFHFLKTSGDGQFEQVNTLDMRM